MTVGVWSLTNLFGKWNTIAQLIERGTGGLAPLWALPD
jgi:hypothetical protein